MTGQKHGNTVLICNFESVLVITPVYQHKDKVVYIPKYREMKGTFVVIRCLNKKSLCMIVLCYIMNESPFLLIEIPLQAECLQKLFPCLE